MKGFQTLSYSYFISFLWIYVYQLYLVPIKQLKIFKLVNQNHRVEVAFLQPNSIALFYSCWGKRGLKVGIFPVCHVNLLFSFFWDQTYKIWLLKLIKLAKKSFHFKGYFLYLRSGEIKCPHYCFAEQDNTLVGDSKII